MTAQITPHKDGTLKEKIEAKLRYDLGLTPDQAKPEDILHALSLAVREPLINGLFKTRKDQAEKKVKRLYYLSMEFLIGQSLLNNLNNLHMLEEAREAIRALGFDLDELAGVEHDAALGNGGLGRLAACFIDSLATLGMAGFGCGIKYEYGLFRQDFIDQKQIEHPDNWHSEHSPWLIERAQDAWHIPLYGRIERAIDPQGNFVPMWLDWKTLVGIPFDMPIAGYGGETVNPLRLYSARASDSFDMQIFNSGDYLRAVEQKISSETVTKVLYPSDAFDAGKELRLIQEYFLVACTLRDCMKTFFSEESDIEKLPERVAIQMNDTHPALAVPELMRILIDENDVSWEKAWAITRRTCAYTNHTLMPEALEKWPVTLFGNVLPRHLDIIYEINRRFLDDVAAHWPDDSDRLRRMSLIEEGGTKQIRMAYLAIIGSHSVNGVAELHSQLVKSNLVPDFYEFEPEKFNNKTNGVTVRRWILQANPGLAEVFSEIAGNDWPRNYHKIALLDKHADDRQMQKRIADIKKGNKEKLARHIYKSQRIALDPESIFDVQSKRIHEYKRQLLNILHVVHLYLRVIEDGDDIVPRTHIFSGKAAPGYYMAKLIIQLINTVADRINRDDRINGRLRIAFVPDYKVSLAETIIPAADISEQISTAGMEASGTGNMKFAMNGALTIGTLDGANVEILEEVGDENIYIFGKKADEISSLQENGTYRPRDFYEGDPMLRRTIDALVSGRLSRDRGLFRPIYDVLLDGGDPFFHMIDFTSYREAHERISNDFLDQAKWHKSAIHNIARMGKFSSDRTILEYTKHIWDLQKE
jgi:glycogen phosphorylase